MEGDSTRSDDSLPGVASEPEVEKFTPSSPEHKAKESSRQIKGVRWVLVVIAILSSTFLYALDNTVVANIRPSIIKSLGQIEKLPWISVAYAVGEVGSSPFWYIVLDSDFSVIVSDCR